ncbi:calcium-binding protein [Roseivivax sp. CAU 1761]
MAHSKLFSLDVGAFFKSPFGEAAPAARGHKMPTEEVEAFLKNFMNFDIQAAASEASDAGAYESIRDLDDEFAAPEALVSELQAVGSSTYEETTPVEVLSTDSIAQSSGTISAQDVAPAMSFVTDSDFNDPTIRVGPDMTADQLQSLIDTAESGTVIELAAGIYNFDETIEIGSDGVTLIGAGSGQTILNVAGLEAEAVTIGTGWEEGAWSLEAGAAKGDKVVTLSSADHSFEAGDFLYIERESTEAFYDEIGDTEWRNTDVPLRKTIVEVESVDGAEITLKSGLHFDFDTVESTVSEIHLAKDIKVGGFSVDYGLDQADESDFSNTMRAYDRTAVIGVDGTDNLELFDIQAHDLPSIGLNVRSSREMFADDLEFTGAHNKGSGGNGYAFQIRETFDSEFVNLSDQNMRHSVVFASWDSAVGNEVHVEQTDRDINFHGGRDGDNTVRVDKSLRDAASDVMTPSLFINTDGEHYGSATDASINAVKFGHMVGSRLGDHIKGYDNGAWLEGQYGSDTLEGGAGNDVLIGGGMRDILDGHGGVDIAIWDAQRADVEITVTDEGLIVDNRADPGSADTVSNVEWLLFQDTAIRVETMEEVDRKVLDGIFTGTGEWEHESRTYSNSGNAALDPLNPGFDASLAERDSENGVIPDTEAPGVPHLIGTDGKDTFDVDVEGTIVEGLGDWDVVNSSVDFTMSDDIEKLVLGDGDINGTGSRSDDLIQASDGDNVLTGNGGDDRIFARLGNDTLNGGDGNDQLNASGGNDILIGGAGQDTLEGNDGADIFVFGEASHSAVGAADVILDFERGVDLIDLSGIDADTTQDGHQRFKGINDADAGLWLSKGDVYGDVDRDGNADFRIDLVNANITEQDFVF